MFDGVIAGHIRRTNRELLVTNLVVFIGCALLFALPSRYWRNFFAGPKQMTHEQLAGITDPDHTPRHFITIPGGKAERIGRETTTSRGSTRTSAEFYVLHTDSGDLLIKNSPSAATDSFTGYIESVPSDVRDKVLSGYVHAHPITGGKVLPMMLDTTGFRGTGYVGLVFLVPLVLLASWNIMKAVRRMLDSSNHPIVRQLARFGDTADVSRSIDAEANSPAVTRVGTVTITQSWILQPSAFNLEVRKLDDLVWLYRRVTQHRTNGVPTGKTHAANICDREGKTLSVQLKEQQVMELLERLNQRVPWAIAGFDQQLEKAWQKDRPSVIAQVDQRRQDYMAAAGRQPAPSRQA